MSTETIHMTPTIQDYLLQHSLREHPVLAELRAETSKLSQSQMQISPDQGQFMALLVTLLNAKKTLDIGTFTGYSALVVALALPSDGRVIACDTSVEWTNVAQKYWEKAQVADRITLKLAPALDTLQTLLTTEAGTFDFAFIDADKGGYIDYYQAAFELLRPGGLIIIDNVLRMGRVADPDQQDNTTRAIRAFNDHIYADQRVTISMLPVADGLTLALKK